MNKLPIIFILFFIGCGKLSPVKLPDFDKDKAFIQSKKPIELHKIHDFIKADDDLNNIPETQIEIVLTEPVTLHSLFQILIAQGVNVIGNLDIQKLISIPNYSGSLRVFLQTIQNSYGLFFKYRNNTLTIRDHTTVYVKVLMSGTEVKLQDLLKTFGIENSFYDQLSGRIVFDTDFYTFQRVQDYFYNNPYLTFIIFDIMILEHEESKEQDKGVDWSGLAVRLNELSDLPFNLSVVGNPNGSFDFNFGKRKLSLQSVYHNLLKKEHFKVIQSARISTLNGYDCTLDVSEKIPYISQINLGTLNDNSNSIVQGYEFDVVTSGLVLNLRPIVSGNLISVLFDSKIQSLIKFIEVGTSSQTVQQPVLAIRNFKNQIVVSPGVTTLIGGLQYQKGGFTNKTLDFLESGLKTNEERTFSISVLLRCELIRYLFTKGGL